ncbi:UNVERIFIED_CONTAM: hypothetical protein GTU68_000701 [Idotea baltica]|nr:hypothetical protein [Idotea baltica]
MEKMSEKHVSIIERLRCYSGFYRLECLKLKHRLFSGQMSDAISREVILRQNAVCVLPYDPVRGEVVLLEQFRIGAFVQGRNPWLLEQVAGLIDDGEMPEQTAYREAKEEADLILSKLHAVLNYYPSPGGSSEYVHLFVGCCSTKDAGGIHGLISEGEDIKVHVLSIKEALQALSDGKIDNAATIITLQWLALNGDKLKEQWI